MKLYADEYDHAIVRALDAVAVSALSRVEVPAALWRKQRIGELSAEDAALLGDAFAIDYHGHKDQPPRFAAVAIGGALLEQAAALVPAHGLRAYDATQLACALAARAADPGCRDFACFDTALRSAASRRGFRLVP